MIIHRVDNFVRAQFDTSLCLSPEEVFSDIKIGDVITFLKGTPSTGWTSDVVVGILPCVYSSNPLSDKNCLLCPGKILFSGHLNSKCLGSRDNNTIILAIEREIDYLSKELFEI